MLINNDTIIKDTNPLIRQKSEDVPLPLSSEDEQLLRDMMKYVVDSTDPEIAERENLRLTVLSLPSRSGEKTAVVGVGKGKDNDVRYQFMLVNPRIVSSSVQPAYLDGGEGCLSVAEEHEGHVVRCASVKVRAYDLFTNQNIEIRARGYLAIVLQHELDHFKGILFYDHIDRKDPFHETEGAMVI